MRKSLHFIGAPQESRHTVFLEGEEAPSFSLQQHFDTPAELLSRAYNRPRNAQLESAVLASNSAAQLSNSRKLDRYILAQSHTAQGQPGYLYPKKSAREARIFAEECMLLCSWTRTLSQGGRFSSCAAIQQIFHSPAETGLQTCSLHSRPMTQLCMHSLNIAMLSTFTGMQEESICIQGAPAEGREA